MARGVPLRFLVLLFPLTFLSDTNAYPRSGFLEDDPEREPFGRPEGENDSKPRREEALQKMQEILGIRSQSDDLPRRKVPPQFMMELYNTIADPSGVTRGRNPYNARVVRSYAERGNFFNTTSSYFYFFNVSGLEVNESVLEAELHLYRKKTPPRSNLVLASPYYLIRVYQVLDDRSLDTPDLHRLLNVRYVSAHVSGWQVFNVKQAVLEWVTGEPNLGLLVTAQDLFEDEVSVEFSRRNDYRHGRQPILVLFNDDRNGRDLAADVAPQYYAYGSENDDGADAERSASSEKNEHAGYYRRRKRHREAGQPEEALLADRHEPEFFQRQKHVGTRDGESDDPRESREIPILGAAVKRREAAPSGRRSTGIGLSDARITRVLTSMDIYERAAFREKLGQVVRNRSLKRLSARQQQQQQHRSPRSAGEHDIMGARQDEANKTNECTRHELYVDFRDIGLSSSIIAPSGYSAYQCRGACEPPLSQDQRPTNHATIQAIVHKLGLVEGVQRPCCVPTKLLRTSILFYDDNENVVLKMYEDMIADSCGCR